MVDGIRPAEGVGVVLPVAKLLLTLVHDRLNRCLIDLQQQAGVHIGKGVGRQAEGDADDIHGMGADAGRIQDRPCRLAHVADLPQQRLGRAPAIVEPRQIGVAALIDVVHAGLDELHPVLLREGAVATTRCGLVGDKLEAGLLADVADVLSEEGRGIGNLRSIEVAADAVAEKSLFLKRVAASRRHKGECEAWADQGGWSHVLSPVG